MKSLARLLTGLSLFAVSLPGVPITEFSVSTDKISSQEWSARGVDLTLTPTDRVATLRLTVAEFQHQALKGSVKGIDFRCSELQQVDRTYLCKQGDLLIADSPFGAQRAVVGISYIDAEDFEIEFNRLQVAQGGVKLGLKMAEDGWHLRLDGKNLDLDLLRTLIPLETVPPEWSLSGELSIKARLSGVASTLNQAEVTAAVERLNYSDQDGLQVAEDGFGEARLLARRRGAQWSGSASLELPRGQYYSDPYYTELSGSPLTLALSGDWSPEQNQLLLEQFQLGLHPTVKAWGAGRIDLTTANLQQAKVAFESDHLDQLYTLLIQPMVIGSMVDELLVSGGLEGEFELNQGRLERISTRFKSIDIDDTRGVFALNGLNGALSWSNQGSSEATHLELQDGHLYQIPHGPVSVDMQLLQNGIRLNEPVAIPLLGGRIIIDRLEAENLFHGAPQWQTGAEVIDLSLQQLSAAFDWPTLSGTLNGKLPTMHYQDQLLDFDGVLEVDLFGGRIEVEALKIKQPLGRVPELFAAVEMKGLDLEKITRTFSFGHIEGGLEGWVNGLHLLNWQPVAFQAQFNSPQDDQLPHRISQRAVDNLTSIGNGIGGGLQNTFLGIFKEFRYNRIELRASLDGDLAELGGINHPDGGYYLVKGAGLPRIDVIARNRRVAWKTLVERLKNIRVEGMKVR